MDYTHLLILSAALLVSFGAVVAWLR